jgi:uncharacterized membrane protein
MTLKVDPGGQIGPAAFRGINRSRLRLNLAGLLLGVGLGGFVDGIVLHQILQWHHLLTSQGDHPASTVAGLEANTLADGLFHVFAWFATAGGLVLLWRAMRSGSVPTGALLLGLVLAGWGAFNLVEGTIDHHILGIHHVRAGEDQPAYDVGFLGFGAALLLGGLGLARREERERRGRQA